MPLPQGFELEPTVAAGPKLPPGFQLEPPEIPGPRRAPATSAMGAFGRSAASLADVTVGSVLPAAVQTLAYPVLRAFGRTPEEATASSQQMASSIDAPFGKAFGVANTPEYQQEASRQLMTFVGQNVQKGAKWLSEKTGLPQTDIENMLATGTLAAPKVVGAGVKGAKAVAATPAAQEIRAGLQMPFEPALQARRERLSAESYARGPQIDAATEAQRLSLVLNPTDIQPTTGPRIKSALAGVRGEEAIQQANRPRVNEIAKNEMGLPATAQLNDAKTFDAARAAVAAPYDKIKQIPVIQVDESARAALEALRPSETLIDGDAATAQLNSRIDSALKQVDAGMSGQAFVDNVSKLRKDARRLYRNKNALPEQIDMAETNLAIANVLEGMIEKSVFDPKLLSDYRAARQKMAQIYAYEAATDLNTGFVDPSKIARITAKDSTLTGDIASLGRIAGNFPGAFSPQTGTPWYSTKVSRAGFGGAGGAVVGGALGSLVGAPVSGTIIGTALGGLAGEAGSRMMANRLASPAYQAGLQVADYRIPVANQLAAMPPIPQNRAIVPYQAPIEVLGPNEGPYQPNFVFARPQPEARFVGPQVGPAQLPAPSAESTLNALRTEDARRAAMSRTLGQQAEAQQAAAEAAARRPARKGVELVFDAAGNLVPAPTAGAGGLTPSALESAVQKLSGGMVTPTETQFQRVSTGKPGPQGEQKFYVRSKTEESPSTREPQAFALTAEERIAWNKTKADLSEVMPGMKALSDEAIAAKVADRNWAQTAVDKARAKSEQLARQEALLAEQLANRDNLRLLARDIAAKQKELTKIRADRERMMDLLVDLEENLRAPRPQSGGGQGPKTRAFKRNQLAPESESVNALIKP